MEKYDSIMAAALIGIKNDEVARLPADSEIDHVFSDRFEKKMKRMLSSADKNGKYRGSAFTIAKRAAVIILCVGITAFSAAMLNPTARADFKNAVYAVYESFIKFSFDTTPSQPTDFDNIYDVKAAYIPDGFVLTETSDEYEAVGYTYENKETEESFNIYVSVNDGLSVLTDSKKSRYEKTSINGREAYVVSAGEKGEEYTTVIITGAKITVTVYGYMAKEDLMKIAQGIR